MPRLSRRWAQLLLPILVMIGACGPDSTMPDPAAVAGQPGAKVFLTPLPTGSFTVLPAPARLPGQPIASPCSGGCPGDSSVVDFEGLGGAGTIHQLTTQFASLGVEFSNALAAVAPAYDSVAFPPRSGVASSTADAFAPGGPTGILYVDLLGDAVRVKGYLTSVGPMTLQCFNAADSLVGETPFAGDNIGHPVANQPVEVSAPGIRRCQFNGSNDQYSLDDLTVFWDSAVPTLSCNSVDRGQTGTCTVSGADSVIAWRFDGVLGARTSGVAPDVVRVDSSGSSVWEGRATLSGVVSVHVIAGTLDTTLTTPWIVKARTGPVWRWSAATDWHIVQDGPELCNYKDLVGEIIDSQWVWWGDTTGGKLGANRRASGCQALGTIEPNVQVSPEVGTTIGAGGGPNSQTWYVDSTTFHINRVTEVNNWIRVNGDTIQVKDSTDYHGCRGAMPNPPPLGADLWINFFNYNLVCRGHSVQPLINAVLTHEGFGTQNQNDPATANGHEARRRLAAQQVTNDPRAIIESYVSPVSANNLRLLVRDSVLKADDRIVAFAADATGLVKDNYIVPGGGCGGAWFLSKPQPLHYEFLTLVYSLPPPIGQICF